LRTDAVLMAVFGYRFGRHSRCDRTAFNQFALDGAISSASRHSNSLDAQSGVEGAAFLPHPGPAGPKYFAPLMVQWPGSDVSLTAKKVCESADGWRWSSRSVSSRSGRDTTFFRSAFPSKLLPVGDQGYFFCRDPAFQNGASCQGRHGWPSRRKVAGQSPGSMEKVQTPGRHRRNRSRVSTSSPMRAHSNLGAWTSGFSSHMGRSDASQIVADVSRELLHGSRGRSSPCSVCAPSIQVLVTTGGFEFRWRTWTGRAAALPLNERRRAVDSRRKARKNSPN